MPRVLAPEHLDLWELVNRLSGGGVVPGALALSSFNALTSAAKNAVLKQLASQALQQEVCRAMCLSGPEELQVRC